MKKLFFMAAVASVALVGCVKNEMAPSAADQNEITFTTPVVAPVTKAIIDGVVYPKTEQFGVYAWHENSANAYMNKVQVTNGAYKDNVENEAIGENGGWKPVDKAYYWPKDGSLDFDAFSPWSVNTKVNATKADGITITGFEAVDVAATDAAAIDLMFAKRSEDKTTVNDGANADIPYDGVDIVFNHALSAVQIKAKTANTYEGTTIVITSIQIVNAASVGTFEQKESTQKPGWSTVGTEKAYVYAGNTVDNTGIDCGTKLLLPQAFDQDLAINVEYTINGLAQTGTFKFINHKNGTHSTEGAVTVESWEMGTKYIYTLVFTLDEIFFEPVVTEWETITVAEGAVVK